MGRPWPAVRPVTPPTASRSEAGQVFEASRDVPGLDRLLTDFVAELAYHVVNLAICLNPVRIAVGGGMVRSWDRLRPGLQHALTAGMPFPPELVAARFPSDAPLIGASRSRRTPPTGAAARRERWRRSGHSPLHNPP